MKALLTAFAGILMIGAVGASGLNAQGVSVRINKGNKSVEVNTGRGGGRIERDQPKHQPQAGHYITVKKKVWHPGHYETVSERVYVPATTKTVIERVYVPAETYTVRERRVDSCGHVFFVNVCKTIPAHYKNVEKCVVVPAHYDTCERQVWVEGHYDIVEERGWVKGDPDCDDGHGNVSHRGR
ncbi:MAG: hypothetical protein IT464_00180 [Planctomycetes bacterium]|nr:hypothetical protein [Planctomycetota bacterium]